MRVLVCGSRHYGDLISLKNNRNHPSWSKREKEYRFVIQKLNELSLEWPRISSEDGNWLPDITVINGKAKGVDSTASDWAVVNWTGLEEYPADWNLYGKAAGPIRNKQMLDEGKPDLVVAFLAKDSRGTRNMIEQAEKAGIPVRIINI